MFYTYRQNNSGGSFDIDDNVAVVVCIEAPSLDWAVRKAESIGLYFDGEGDCHCCGYRWYVPYADPTKEPEVYGKPVKGSEYSYRIHYLDGRIERGEGRGRYAHR